MFTLDEQTFEIHISRGDSATLDLQFEGDLPEAGDTIVMSLKRTPSEKQSKWEKEATVYGGDLARFRILPEDTATLPFGKYFWDLRVFFQSGDVTTPLDPRPFYIDEVIGNDR